jgi:CRISPR-associated endonuclease/helicase Cas3
MARKAFAHSLDGKTPEKWQPLEDHLQNVAKLAADFARPFGGDQWAWLAGLWHDLGKYSDDFQRMLFAANGIESHLESKPGKVIHSQAGGHLAQRIMTGGMERIFCWLIMGHHAGLADFCTDRTGAKALEPKMKNPEISDTILSQVPDHLKNPSIPDFPGILKNGADISFFIRMLFSCIVDADYLDTEAFMDKGKTTIRAEAYPTLKNLLMAFDGFIDELCQRTKASEINTIRRLVLDNCRSKAQREPDVFSLTVPTGGGKTLSSLAFALRHAVKWKKRRIIYVIPYTSIIEQTVQVFRDIHGFENGVLEHHCNVSDEDESKESVRSRLASENWDAPIVVTTAVQFFESLYANKASRCRKLHNIVNSVVIFDEAQCIPPAYLRPAVFAIRELSLHYKVSAVLCTATQPVLTQTDQFDFKFKEGFSSVVEITENPRSLAKALKRVEVESLKDMNPISYEELSEHIISENQSVLCIVNTKDDCRTLAKLLPKERTIHLSTCMCAAHRLQTFQEIKELLKPVNGNFYVVSTSLVEAGVDLDFPVVYRALAGLDSVAQAAGRCNREKKLQGFGKTVVFVPEKQPGYIKAPASLALEFFKRNRLDDIFLPETFDSYFKRRFFQLGDKALDEMNVLGLLGGRLNFYFYTAAQRFRLIDDDWQHPMIVPFGEAQDLVRRLMKEPWNARKLFRQLQRFTVSIPQKLLYQLIDEHQVRELVKYPGTYVLENPGLYSEHFGFTPPDEIDGYDPEMTIV